MSHATYDVLREHEGDRFYRTGETRQMAPSDATHLVKLGVLKKSAAKKSEQVPRNKAEGPAALNKTR